MISKPIPSFGKVHRYCWPLISRMHILQLQFKMAKYLWITLCKYHVHKIQQPKRNLVYQKKIWSNKKIFGIPKKNLVDQKNEKLTGQLVYQRDWPKVHGRRYKDMPIFSLTFESGIDNFNFYIKIVLVAQNSFRTLKELHFPFLKAFFARVAAVKVAFFQKAWCIFLIAQKMCRKLSWKRDLKLRSV